MNSVRNPAAVDSTEHPQAMGGNLAPQFLNNASAPKAPHGGLDRMMRRPTLSPIAANTLPAVDLRLRRPFLAGRAVAC